MSNESEVSNWKYSHFLKNEKNNFDKNDILNVLTKKDMDDAYQIISGWNNYIPTPLISTTIPPMLNGTRGCKDALRTVVIPLFIIADTVSDKYPGIVHVDGTSRVQTVTMRDNKPLYNLLRLWKNKTGCPMLLNTSLNVKGEPMVNDIDDAKRFATVNNVKVFT